MKIEDLTRNMFARLNFKLFLRRFCLTHLNPKIILIDDQHVSFSLIDNGKEFAMVAVYASTCYLKRRRLWETLGNMLTQFNLPWNFFGDLSTILRSCEHQGTHSPSRTHMNDFQIWTNDYDLPLRIHFFLLAN